MTSMAIVIKVNQTRLVLLPRLFEHTRSKLAAIEKIAQARSPDAVAVARNLTLNCSDARFVAHDARVVAHAQSASDGNSPDSEVPEIRVPNEHVRHMHDRQRQGLHPCSHQSFGSEKSGSRRR